MSLMCEDCKCSITLDSGCGNGCPCCNLEVEVLEYYATCSRGCDEKEIETVLEGVGEYHRESNTIYLNPCHVCGESMEVSGWLDECEECGELHYEAEECPVADDQFNLS